MDKDNTDYWNAYLSERYNTIDNYQEFYLKNLDQFFESYQPPAGGAKLLEFSGGGVVCQLISAAPKCKEIVYSEFIEGNREVMNLWLRKDPSAYNWHQFFSYIVRTLEGGTEKDVEERKKLLRKTVTAVVPCDIFQADPVDDKGPYDILSTALTLEYLGLTKEQYKESLTKLAHLVKPGGFLLMQAHENVHSLVHNGKTAKENPLSREFLRESLQSAGFSCIRIDFLPCESLSAKVQEHIVGVTSLMFAVATKEG